MQINEREWSLMQEASRQYEIYNALNDIKAILLNIIRVLRHEHNA